MSATDSLHTYVVCYDHESIAVYVKNIYQAIRINLRKAYPIYQFSSWNTIYFSLRST